MVKGLRMDDDVRVSTTTLRWLLGALAVSLLGAGGFYVTSVSGATSRADLDHHNVDGFAHPQLTDKFQAFQRAETDRIIQAIDDRWSEE